MHRGERVAVTRVAGGRESGPDAVPTGHDLTRLSPPEDPGDRAQAVDARRGVGAARGPRAHVHPAELLDRRGSGEVGGQVGVIDQSTVTRLSRRRRGVHDRVPHGELLKGVARTVVQQRGIHHGREDLLEVVSGEGGQEVLV